MPTYTLDELIKKMEPQNKRDLALIRKCVDGLTMYTAQRAQADPGSPKITEMRDLIERLDDYWDLNSVDSDTPQRDFLNDFDEQIETAKSGEAVTENVYHHGAAVVYGLYRYGEDMVGSQGDAAKDEILAMSRLMKEIAAAWDFEPHVLDDLTARLEAAAQRLGEPVIEPAQQAPKPEAQPLRKTIKLYCPLEVKTDPDSTLGEDYGDIVNEYEYAAIPNDIAMRYTGEIQAAIIKDMHKHDEGERGLAPYLHSDDGPADKVYSIKPSVEVWNDKLWGIVNVETTADLTPQEMADLNEFCVGQMSDGWGEHFEQWPVRTRDGDLYVSFWQSGSGYFLKPEQEFKNAQPEIEQTYEPTMGGMY